MVIYVKNPEVDELANQLMQLTKKNKTEVLRSALTKELERLAEKNIQPRIRKLQERVAKRIGAEGSEPRNAD